MDELGSEVSLQQHASLLQLACIIRENKEER